MDARQAAAVSEGVLIEGGYAVRQVQSAGKGRAVAKGIGADGCQRGGELHVGKAGTGLEGSHTHCFYAVRQFKMGKAAAGRRKAFWDAGQPIRQVDLLQILAAGQQIFACPDLRPFKCDPFEAAAVGEGVISEIGDPSRDGEVTGQAAAEPLKRVRADTGEGGGKIDFPADIAESAGEVAADVGDALSYRHRQADAAVAVVVWFQRIEPGRKPNGGIILHGAGAGEGQGLLLQIQFPGDAGTVAALSAVAGIGHITACQGRKLLRVFWEDGGPVF